MTTTTHLREAWLRAATIHLTRRFAAAGVTVPPDVQISCGWPGGGSAQRRVGECWSRASSASRVNEIFISPHAADPLSVLDVLGHELLHAVDDCRSGHGRDFRHASKRVGYTGGKRAAATGDTLTWLKTLLPRLGVYPHAAMTLPAKRTGSQHGLHKLACGCGNILYATEHKLASFGSPSCPRCQEEMRRVARQIKKIIIAN